MDASARRLTLCPVVAFGALVVVVGCGVMFHQRPSPGEQAIADRVAQYGPAARARLAPFFAAAGITYPPERFALLGFKLERELHLLASGSGRDLTFIRSYAIQGMSGTLGPKLHEGDGQVPEGIYTIAYLNPDSVAHLSLALSYPNDYDRARAAEDRRDTLGGEVTKDYVFDAASPGGGKNFVVVAKAPIDKFKEHGERRGWRHALLLSSAGNTFNRDYHAEEESGQQCPLAHVFARRGGKVHQPEGRGPDWAPKLSY